MKLLLIEDNAELRRTIAEYLLHEHYICEVAPNFEKAYEKLELYSYDCVLLDIMLPDGSGMSLLKSIRKAQNDSSVIIISAKNDLDVKINGLDAGADDYMTKPFSLPELSSRIKAVTRRKSGALNCKLECNEITVNLQSMEVMVGAQPIVLTKKEINLLIHLVNNKNKILSRQTIASHLWGDYTDNLDNFDFVYQHVKNLRKKIIDAGGNDYISTIYGLGYKFVV